MCLRLHGSLATRFLCVYSRSYLAAPLLIPLQSRERCGRWRVTRRYGHTPVSQLWYLASQDWSDRRPCEQQSLHLFIDLDHAISLSQFAASIPPIAYSLLGTSRQLNVAAEAALSLLVGQAVTDYRHSYPDTPPDKLGVAVATAIGVQVRFPKSPLRCYPHKLQVGLFAFLLGFLRLGFLDVVLSRALLRGFVTAIAVVIAVCVWSLSISVQILMLRLGSNSSQCLVWLRWRTKSVLKQL